MKHICIALVVIAAASFSTGNVAAQYEYGPEEEGAEPSPIPDPDTETEESGAEAEVTEEERRKERGCAVDRSSSTPSKAPIEALLFGVGLIAFRRLRAAR